MKKLVLEKIEKLEKELKDLKESLKEEDNQFKDGDWLYFTFAGGGLLKYRYTEPRGYGNAIGYYEVYYWRLGKLIEERNEELTNTKWENTLVKATSQQILSELSKIANYKGFKLGTNYKSAYDNCNGGRVGGCWRSDSGNLYDICGEYIYYNGKWAEIIEKPIIKIENYIAEFNKNEKTVKFGCKTISLEQLKAIQIVCNLNKQFDICFEIATCKRSEDYYIKEQGSSSRELWKKEIEELIKELES